MEYTFLSHYHSSTPRRNHSCKFLHVNVFGRLLHNQLQSIVLLCHDRLCHNVRIRDRDKMLVNDGRVLVFHNNGLRVLTKCYFAEQSVTTEKETFVT